MRTNIDLDEELVREAFKLTGAKTRREFVHMALDQLAA
jgi:Arc/MetJ family transcription regulator